MSNDGSHISDQVRKALEKQIPEICRGVIAVADRDKSPPHPFQNPDPKGPKVIRR